MITENNKWNGVADEAAAGRRSETIARDLFGFVFKNRDRLETDVYRTLTHDLGIIIRDDAMAIPYTVGRAKEYEEALGFAPGPYEKSLDDTIPGAFAGPDLV